LSGKKGKKTRNLENPKKTLAKKDPYGANKPMKKMYLGAPNQLKKGNFSELEREKSDEKK